MKEFEVIKEFAGIKKGEKINVNPVREKHMIEMGYIKPLKAKVEPSQKNRKKKIDPASENKQDK